MTDAILCPIGFIHALRQKNIPDGDFRTLHIDAEGFVNVEKNISWKKRSFRNIRDRASGFFASYVRKDPDQP